MIVLLPAVRIHIWGGLGSQLYGLALKIDLQQKYKYRKINLVFHNSGVTRRDAELAKVLLKFESKVKLDFEKNLQNKNHLDNNLIFRKFVLVVFRTILVKFGFVATSNNDDEFNSLRPWISSIRGHYSNRRIQNTTILSVIKTLDFEKRISEVNYSYFDLGIHYRLGDLVTLKEKNPLALSRLKSGIDKIESHAKIQNSIVFSDSINLASEMLSLYLKPSYPDSALSAFDTIAALVSTKQFLGTPSKITEWITLIRTVIYTNPRIWLPVEMKAQFKTILQDINLINYY